MGLGSSRDPYTYNDLFQSPIGRTILYITQTTTVFCCSFTFYMPSIDSIYKPCKSIQLRILEKWWSILKRCPTRNMTKRFSHPAWVQTQTSPLLVGFHLSPSLEKLDCWAAHTKFNSQTNTFRKFHQSWKPSNSTILIGPNWHPTKFSCPKHSMQVFHHSLLSRDLGITKKCPFLWLWPDQ